MKIGELARAAGLTAKTVRYYELRHLLKEPRRTESGYRLYSAEDLERLAFIVQAKHLGLSLEEVREVLSLHDQREAPCVHVLALLDQKVAQVDAVIAELTEFRAAIARLRDESQGRLERLPEEARICGIIEQGVHARGELALAWLGRRPKASSPWPLDLDLDWKV